MSSQAVTVQCVATMHECVVQIGFEIICKSLKMSLARWGGSFLESDSIICCWNIMEIRTILCESFMCTLSVYTRIAYKLQIAFRVVSFHAHMMMKIGRCVHDLTVRQSIQLDFVSSCNIFKYI